MALEQKYLNVTARAEGYMDIMMYLPDKSVNIANVNSDDILQYSNINSIKDIKNYTSTTIATLEENLWLLNGSFINPTPGRLYNGYISNSVSNEDGHFGTNPVINIDLYSTSNVEFFSLIFNNRGILFSALTLCGRVLSATVLVLTVAPVRVQTV